MGVAARLYRIAMLDRANLTRDANSGIILLRAVINSARIAPESNPASRRAGLIIPRVARFP
jgi:hypothetical protein